MGMYVSIDHITMKKTDYEEWVSNPEIKKSPGYEIAFYDYNEETGKDEETCETCYTYRRFENYLERISEDYPFESEVIEVGDNVVIVWARYW